MKKEISTISRGMIVKNNVDSMIAAADVIRKCRDTLDRLNCMNSLSEEEGVEIQYTSFRCVEKEPSPLPPICGETHPLPGNSLAPALARLLRKSIPQALQMQGLTMKTQDNRCHFCISGSFSLSDLQTLAADLEGPSHL